MNIAPSCNYLFLFLYTIFKEYKHIIFRSMTRLLYEPMHEKTNNLGFRSGPTQTDLYSRRRMLEA